MRVPSFTADKPHPITCIKRNIRDCLIRYSGNDLTIVCDRDYCYESKEIFANRQAINITAVQEFVDSPVKSGKDRKYLNQTLTKKDLACLYDANVTYELQIYVEDCDCDDSSDDCECLTGKDKAYAILSHVMETLYCKQDEIGGRRILYRGSTSTSNSEGETEIAVVVASFEVQYILDQTNPSGITGE